MLWSLFYAIFGGIICVFLLKQSKDIIFANNSGIKNAKFFLLFFDENLKIIVLTPD
jgi:hypothetical protein